MDNNKDNINDQLLESLFPQTDKPLTRNMNVVGLISSYALVKQGADINQINDNGDTFLHRAFNENDLDKFGLILIFKPNLNATDKNGLTVIDKAINNKNLEFLKALSKAVSESESDLPTYQRLEEEIHSIHFEKFQEDMNNGLIPDINQRFLRSARDGDIYATKFCLQNGADINFKNEIGLTAEIIARQWGRYDVEKYLKSLSTNKSDINFTLKVENKKESIDNSSDSDLSMS